MCKNDFCVACGTASFLFCIIAIVLGLIGLGITKIVLGSMYLHDCSIERMIPIYLIVSGVVPLLFSGFSRHDDEGRSLGFGDCCGIFAFLFNVTWLVCGSIWVYPNYGKLTHQVPCSATVTSSCYHGNCNMTLLRFAFAMVTIDWLCFGIGVGMISYIYVKAFCK